SRSLMRTVSNPVGQEVQTPACFAQNEQLQARAGISDGSGCQSSEKEILPQWQRPVINQYADAPHRLRAVRQDPVVGSITVTISLILVIGKPASRECSRRLSSPSAR